MNLSLRQIPSHTPLRNLGITSAVCPICDNIIKVKPPSGLEEMLVCPACQHQLAYFSIEPIVLFPAEELSDDMDIFFDESTFGEYLGPEFENIENPRSSGKRDQVHG